MELRSKVARHQAGGFIRALRIALPALMVAVVLAGWSSPGHSSASQTTQTTTSSDTLQKVTSTLDGKRSIPLRTHWIATAHPAGAIVTQVDFLIDRHLAWTEMNSPYVFGSDDDGTNLGFLITTWLRPGRHSFTVRAIGESGRVVSDTVTARVTAAPQPPTALQGTWTRTMTQQDITNAGLTLGPPTGRWQLVFDRVGAWELDPLGTGLGTQYAVTGNTINAYAPIQEAPCCSSGSGGIVRYGHHGLGGVDCNPSGPFGSYSWSVHADTLTLTPIVKGCPSQEAIWAGVWTLQSPRPPPA